MSKFVFTASRPGHAPANVEMSLEEIIREAVKRHPDFSAKRIERYVRTLEPGQTLSWFVIMRVS